MIKKEVLEIRKLFRMEDCCLDPHLRLLCGL